MIGCVFDVFGFDVLACGFWDWLFCGLGFVDCVELPVMMTCLLWVLFGFSAGVCLFVLCLVWVGVLSWVLYLIV